MKFGKYAIVDEITHKFKQEPDWWWKINPPTSGDELNMSKFFIQERVVREPDGTTREYPPTPLEIAYREIALTFGGTNIPLEGSKPEPILTVGLAVEDIEEVLKQMPHAMVMEVWDAIGEAVIGWGPAPKAKKESKK
jgi:hypothetical protein